MKIVIATPLYPPEIAEPAPYVKELARRLAKNHQVTVIIFGHLPEKIPGVSFICINKLHPLPMRLLCFSFALWKAALNADVIYAENGASVELPAGFVTFFTRRPLIIHIGDPIACKKAEKKLLLKYIKRFALKCARQTINNTPLPRPEILPFMPNPQSELGAYNKSWNAHINILENIFTHV